MFINLLMPLNHYNLWMILGKNALTKEGLMQALVLQDLAYVAHVSWWTMQSAFDYNLLYLPLYIRNFSLFPVTLGCGGSSSENCTYFEVLTWCSSKRLTNESYHFFAFLFFLLQNTSPVSGECTGDIFNCKWNKNT